MSAFLLSAEAAKAAASQVPAPGDSTETILAKLLSRLSHNDFPVPPFDYEARTYFGSTNNVQTKTFKSGGSEGTTVAVLTYTYVSGGAADNDRVATIIKS